MNVSQSIDLSNGIGNVFQGTVPNPFTTVSQTLNKIAAEAGRSMYLISACGNFFYYTPMPDFSDSCMKFRWINDVAFAVDCHGHVIARGNVTEHGYISHNVNSIHASLIHFICESVFSSNELAGILAKLRDKIDRCPVSKGNLDYYGMLFIESRVASTPGQHCVYQFRIPKTTRQNVTLMTRYGRLSAAVVGGNYAYANGPLQLSNQNMRLHLRELVKDTIEADVIEPMVLIGDKVIVDGVYVAKVVSGGVTLTNSCYSDMEELIKQFVRKQQ